jgi:hypothetical protein
MPVPDVTPEPTLVVTHRKVPRRRTDDDWWELLQRNPETGEERWERWRPLYPVEIAMGLGEGDPPDNIT